MGRGAEVGKKGEPMCEGLSWKLLVQVYWRFKGVCPRLRRTMQFLGDTFPGGMVPVLATLHLSITLITKGCSFDFAEPDTQVATPGPQLKYILANNKAAPCPPSLPDPPPSQSPPPERVPYSPTPAA